MLTILRKYKVTNLSKISLWIIASIFVTLLVKTCAFLYTGQRIGGHHENKADSALFQGTLLLVTPIDQYLFLIFGYVIYQMYKVLAMFKLTDETQLNNRIRFLRKGFLTYCSISFLAFINDLTIWTYLAFFLRGLAVDCRCSGYLAGHILWHLRSEIHF